MLIDPLRIVCASNRRNLVTFRTLWTAASDAGLVNGDCIG
jgi:hypothetical protein